jgi:hypothetical protein
MSGVPLVSHTNAMTFGSRRWSSTVVVACGRGMSDVGLVQHAWTVDVGTGCQRRGQWDEGDLHTGIAPNLGLPG